MRRHPSWDATSPRSRAQAQARALHELTLSGFGDMSSLTMNQPRTLIADSPPLPEEFSSDGTPPSRRLRSISQESSVASLSLDPNDNVNRPPHFTANFISHSRGSTITTSSGTETDPRVTRGQVGPKPKKKRIRIKTERRREQCRRNQARYRNKQKLSAIQLEDTVEQLRAEVEQLQHQHEALYRTPSPTRARPDELVLHLFDAFRFGLNVGREDSYLSSTPPNRHLPALEDQITLVTAAFEADLQVGDACGRTLFLEQTRRFSTLFDAVEVVLERIEQPCTGPDTIQTTFRLDLRVSTTTLRSVFPHLVRAEHYQLRWKLLGQRLRCAGSGSLVFNDQGRVAQINWSLDLVAALQTVLTIEETAAALQHAQIEQDAYLVTSGEETPVRVRHVTPSTGLLPQRQADSRYVALYARDGPDWEETASDFQAQADDKFATV